MKLCKFVLIGLFFIMCAVQGLAVKEGTGTREDPFIIPQTNQTIKIDGKVEDEEWKDALEMDIPYETWPGDNTPARAKTDCFLAYDNSKLYIGVRAYDPHPEKIRSFYFERDKIITDDMIVVFLDTFNDERRAYGFRSNAMGVQFDDIRNRLGVSLAWDAIYATAAKIYDWGYTVEMAIPFNQLRFQHTKEDQVWGLDIRRIYPRLWLTRMDSVKLDRNNFCLMCQFVKIKGFKGIKPGRNIELVPSLTGTRTDQRTDLPDGDFEKLKEKVEAGITARWGFSTNMTINLAVNPDFSQVEADALKLDINEPFALSYEERRPFFYEGVDYFATNFSAVYTRTIRDPLWGLKLTGKTKGNTIGAYVVKDDLTNLIFPGPFGSKTTSLDMSNISSVFRYNRDLGRNYTIGLLGTDREGDDYYNRMGGIDGDFRITKKDRLQFQFLGSSTEYPEEITKSTKFKQKAGEFSGTALDVLYTHDTRNWDITAQYQNLTEGFRADLGFIPQVNYQLGKLSTTYTWYGKPKAWFRELSITGLYNYSATQDGDLIRSGGNLELNYRGPQQSYILLRGQRFRESYLGLNFDQTQFLAYGELRPSGHLEFLFTGIIGDRIDYTNVRLGSRIMLNPEIEIKPGRHTLLHLSHIFERLEVPSGRVYTANISYFRADYHFNVRTFFRAILQYLNYDYNAENYLVPMYSKYKKLSTQLLFSYKINPRTVFFLGYSDNYLGSQYYDLTQNDRTFFAKVSYALSL